MLKYTLKLKLIILRQLHGINSLKAKKSKPVYSPEFKFNEVQILFNGTYIHEVHRQT